MGAEWEKAKQVAAQMAEWDARIVEVTGWEGEGKRNLILHFEPEPTDDAIGFFWIVNLMTRSEFESLDERLDIQQPFDLGFKIGEQVFLPNGNIQKAGRDQVVLWPNHE